MISYYTPKVHRFICGLLHPPFPLAKIGEGRAAITKTINVFCSLATLVPPDHAWKDALSPSDNR